MKEGKHVKESIKIIYKKNYILFIRYVSRHKFIFLFLAQALPDFCGSQFPSSVLGG